jgi:parallel beta-helix repeat protein
VLYSLLKKQAISAKHVRILKVIHTYLLSLLCLLLTSQTHAGVGLIEGLYTIPNATFYQQKNEVVATIDDTSGSIDKLQQSIDSARKSDPTRLLIINLKATTYLITNNPLTLSSRMCLTGTNNSIIRAASFSSSATSLIKIADGSSYVSVNFLTLDGNQADLAGVQGSGLNRVSMDQLQIRNTSRDGLFLQGLGATSFDNQITVSRCDIAASPQSAAIHLSGTTQSLCIDNVCRNSLYGILLESSAHATLVNNQSQFNSGAGIALTNTVWSKVTHNLCNGNVIGISLEGSTIENQWNFIVSNKIEGADSTGIALGGSANVLYDNFIASDVLLSMRSDAGVNRIIPTSGPLPAGGQEYFYPPTTLNRHSFPIMNEKGRTDIITSATTLSTIQSAYDAARSSYPSNVIVLQLTASTITGDVPLSLSSNTCVLLDGTIKLNPGISAFSATNRTFVSISGGTVDGQSSTGRNGLTFSNCSRFIIDQVNWRNFGFKTTRVTGSDVLALLSCNTPSIVQKCTLDGGAARGIWAKGGSGHILSDNSSANMNMDGIDVDAFASYSLVQFNSTFGNIRYGLFVEEAAKYNQLVGNLSRSNSMGINVYSSVVGPTAYNSFVANTCQANARGIRTGGAITRSTNPSTGAVTTKTNSTEHNFFFNNVIRDTPTSTNKSDAGICAQVQGGENYFSRQHLTNNSPDYSDTNTAVFFNPPFSITPLSSSYAYLDWQTAQPWSTPSNLPEADPNKNGVPNLLEYALDLNPLSQNPPTLPLVGWDTNSPDGPWLTFTYRHNLKAQDLTYEILVSEDLQTWSVLNVDEISTFFETVEANPDGDGSSELLKVRTAVSSSSNKLFLRLRVQKK